MAEILRRYPRVILWGFTSGLDSARHVIRHYAHALKRLGKPCVWVDNARSSLDELAPGDLVIAINVDGQHLYPAKAGVNYVLHNFDASHEVFESLEPENLLRLQVYTLDADRYGVGWGAARRYDRGSRTLFQPWGTDLLAEEFCEPVFNEAAAHGVFVGSVWDDGGLGNVDQIRELRDALGARGLALGCHSHVSDEENVSMVRKARLAPAVSGAWQVEHGYLPCRLFKNVSYGSLGITNVPAFRNILGDSFLRGETIADLIGNALALTGAEHLDLVRAQQERVSRYTYRESLEAIERALEEGR